MDLRDRSRRQRAALELAEPALQRRAEVLLDNPPNLLKGERPDLFLQPDQVLDDFRRHQVGPRARDLTQLDKGRAQTLQRPAEGAARGVQRDMAVEAARADRLDAQQCR